MLLATPEIIKKAKEAMGAKEGVMGELAGAAWGRFKEGASAGKKGAMMPVDGALRGANALIGGGIAAKGMSERLRDQPSGIRKLGTVAGGLVGGVSGGITKAPTKTAMRLLSGESELAQRLIATEGLDFIRRIFSGIGSKAAAGGDSKLQAAANEPVRVKASDKDRLTRKNLKEDKSTPRDQGVF
jgi:hypothetical protein